tara:strand:+ start:3566 stop:4393 length:828 start_codon:yes stop_codon:yes gene_type:complete
MKKYNVSLIGRGKMSKAFQKEIKKTNKFNLIKIISKRDIIKNKQIIKKIFKSDKCNLIIITSPIESHFRYLSLSIKNKKNIIIEKPLVKNLNELKKIINLSRNYKKKIMIHHNDVLNFEKFKILKNNYKKLKKIEMIYGKKEGINSNKKPFFDWLPHPLALIIRYFGYPKKFKIIKFLRKKSGSKILEELKIEFLFYDLKIFLIFSNFLKKRTKKIYIFKNNKKEIYDGYKKKNRRTIKILLEKFYKENKINEIFSFYEVYMLLFKIENKLKKLK